MTGDGCSTRNMSLAWFLLTFEKRLTRGPTAIQSLGLAGDLWCWIRDSLSGRTHVTTINGCPAISTHASCYWWHRPLWSDHKDLCFAPPFFSLYCNDLPNISEGIDGDPLLYMYADDTTVYVPAPPYDLLALKLNEVLARLYTSCCENCLTPRPTKTEYMLLSGRRQLTGPK